MTEDLIDAIKDVFEKHWGEDPEGLKCVDVMVEALADVIDSAPDRETKDNLVIYTSSLLVSTMQTLADDRGEPAPEQHEAERVRTARMIVESLRSEDDEPTLH